MSAMPSSISTDIDSCFNSVQEHQRIMINVHLYWELGRGEIKVKML